VAAEVAARYQAYFRDLDVMTIASNVSPRDQFFLFDGVRNTHRTTPAST
jgi:hypothetical protein